MHHHCLVTNIKILTSVFKIELELTLASKYQDLGVLNFPKKGDSTKKPIRQYRSEFSRSISSTWMKLKSPWTLPTFLHWMPEPVTWKEDSGCCMLENLLSPQDSAVLIVEMRAWGDSQKGNQVGS